MPQPGPPLGFPASSKMLRQILRGFHAAAIVLEPAGGALHSWDVASGARRFDLRDLGRAPSSLDFSPDGSLLATMATAGPLAASSTRHPAGCGTPSAQTSARM